MSESSVEPVASAKSVERWSRSALPDHLLDIPRISLKNHTLGSFPERTTTNVSVTVVFFLRARGAICIFRLPLVRGVISKATISVNYTDRGPKRRDFGFFYESKTGGEGKRRTRGMQLRKEKPRCQGPPRHSSDHCTDPYISSRLQSPGFL